jgi:IS1 family transposase
VAKKEKNCDPANPDDDQQGDCWDHIAIDPEHRLVVSAVVGKRTADHTQDLLKDFHQRTAGRIMSLMTSDEHPAYAEVIREVYGEEYRPRRRGRRGRKPARRKRLPKKLVYATVHKTRKNNRVVAVDQRLVYGTQTALAAALKLSSVSEKVNTVFVERHNGTDRNRNGRKVRKTYCFSKDWAIHKAVTSFTLFSYNFCWPVRTLRAKDREGRWQQRTPAMAAGLADHLWPLSEWLAYPTGQY